jgi:hypothetical protein
MSTATQHATASRMPKPPSENTTQVAFKIPDQWLDRAEVLAVALSRPGISTVTKTEILRAALARGLDVLEEETPAKPRAKR